MLYRTENPHGGDIYTEPVRIDFSSNTNPFGIPEGVLTAMTEAVTRAEHYPDPFCREAIRAISAYESVTESSVLIGNGAAELIYSFCEVLKPRSVLMPVPTFSEYTAALSRQGCIPEYFFLREENDFELSSDFLDVLKAKDPEVVFLCDPDNPSGRRIRQDLLTEILSYCDQHGIRLFIDECFTDLTENPSGLKSRTEDTPYLFLLKAFTKSFALAGVRIGYCLCSDTELLTQMSRVVQPWNVSSAAQAAAAAVPAAAGQLRQQVKYIAGERERLAEALESAGFRVIPSDANFLLFKGPNELDTFLRKEGLAIRNCENYIGLGPGWYRTAVRLREENEVLIRAIRSFTGREN